MLFVLLKGNVTQTMLKHNFIFVSLKLFTWLTFILTELPILDNAQFASMYIYQLNLAIYEIITLRYGTMLTCTCTFATFKNTTQLKCYAIICLIFVHVNSSSKLFV